MSWGDKPETRRGLRLIAKGVPLRVAANMVGVASSTLLRARKREGMAGLKRGRPVKPPGP